ncbi:hypothetical protein AAFF_G00211370 [Aldrovandia affinis]|uniref:Ubiquitin-like protease family profile domain-containing protein n=1 Tax=Aldrovandia affinis TaxID=143900 RepID=A0AAD7WUL3_9TELE|nr:hypothetical protein AAFF_G00211370 [Aldrovandia affinis]
MTEDPELIAAAILLPKFRTSWTNDDATIRMGVDYIKQHMEAPSLQLAGTLDGKNHGRPAKRNYQSVHSSDCRAGHLDVKRPKRDIVVSVVKKTVAGVAGLLRLRSPFAKLRSEGRKACSSKEVCPVAVGVDEICTNNLNSWISNMDPTKEKQTDRASTRKHNVKVLYAGNPEKTKGRSQRRSLQFLPARPALSDTEPHVSDPQSQSHKPQLAVEEALKESGRVQYRRLVEMVSEKYTNSKPLPCGRVKPFVTPIVPLLDVQKSTIFSKTCNTTISRPGSTRVSSTAIPSVQRDVSSARQTKDSSRWVDASLCKSRSSASGKVDGKSAMKAKTEDVLIRHIDWMPTSGSVHVPVPTHKSGPWRRHPDLSTEIATRLNLLDRKPVVSSQITVHPKRSSIETGLGPEFPVLTKEILQEVSRALGQNDPNLVLSSAFKLRITQKDLATLRESSWLNDEVINFYLNLVMSRSEQDGGLKVYAFSTFFFPKLRGGGHAAVRRWTKAVDIFLYDIILVPLHLGVHWSLAAIDLKAKSVKYYDSMGQRHDDICSLLLLYLKDEHNTKKSKDLEVSKWVVSSLKSSEIPQQHNGSDCGVFACKYADCIARGQPFTFTQSHMPYFRKKMIWEILNQRLL